MCFNIDPKAKPWRNQRAWKRLKLYDNGRLASPFYSHYQWSTGINRMDRGATYYVTLYGDAVAMHGIYVYKTKKQALLRVCHDEVVVRLRVDSKDFLHTDGKDQATYRKVELVENQPYIEWEPE